MDTDQVALEKAGSIRNETSSSDAPISDPNMVPESATENRDGTELGPQKIALPRAKGLETPVVESFGPDSQATSPHDSAVMSKPLSSQIDLVARPSSLSGTTSFQDSIMPGEQRGSGHQARERKSTSPPVHASTGHSALTDPVSTTNHAVKPADTLPATTISGPPSDTPKSPAGKSEPLSNMQHDQTTSTPHPVSHPSQAHEATSIPAKSPNSSQINGAGASQGEQKDATLGLAIAARQNQELSDAQSKASHARDNEMSLSPAAKRPKLEQSTIDDHVTLSSQPDPAGPLSASKPAEHKPFEEPLTRPQQRHMQKAISNIKRLNPSRHFVVPVDYIKLAIPQYPSVITSPMDLRTLEENFKAGKYTNIAACVADFEMIVNNAITFNGPAHAVAIDATKMKASFDRYMADMPGPEVQTAAPVKKKLSLDVPLGDVSLARREPRAPAPGSARTPVTSVANSPPAFALGPDGLPLIRRDSTIDGRPKREIHRPAPRDLPYANQKPKKKKYQWELKFCDHVLKEILKPKHAASSFVFTQPVDPVALNIPNYLSVVKRPMDFGTIRQKLDRGEYENAKEFEMDARQVFKNCYLFNPEGHEVNTLGHRFEAVFNDVWRRKREWLEENTPTSGQRSRNGTDDDDSGDGRQDDDEDGAEVGEEEDEDDADDGQSEIVSTLQKQIAEMSRQVELITNARKKNKTPPSHSKKFSKPSKAVKKDSKRLASSSTKNEKRVSASSKSIKREKVPHVTYEQKQDISNRINNLSESKMSQALTIIRNNMPSLKGVQEDELELDIDELSNDVLYKLLIFVRRHARRQSEDHGLQQESMVSNSAASKKKSKAMSKAEQEARIAQVQNGLSAFQRENAGNESHEVHQSIEGNGSGEDDDEESESEED